MKPRLRNLFASIALTLDLVGCQPSLPPLTPQEHVTMQTLTHAMTPRCIGRYVIDLPAGMVPSGWGGLKAQDVNIEVAPMNESLFRWRYEQREAELRAAYLDAHPDQPVLKEIIPLRGAIGGIFNRSENGGSNGARTLELHAWRNGYAIKMWVDAADFTSYPEYKNDAIVNQMTVKNDIAPKQGLLIDMVSRTRGRTDNEMPGEQGLCFHGGFLQGPATDEENLDMSYVFTDMPDVSLSIANNSNITEDNTLLDRSKDIEANERNSDGHTLRKGKRKSHGGIAFEEWLSAGTTDEHVKGHLFSLEANSRIGSALTPLLVIDFHNGQRTGVPDKRPPGSLPLDSPPPLAKASLTEGEAVALWDAITNTLRARANGF
jgi:Tle cognate immunity protein 4 C-terminal domain/Tle cognate immunity protein 4 N-terminal domain